MGVEKLSISLPPALGHEVRAAARRSGAGVSAWVAGALEERLRSEALDAFLADWQAEHGRFSDEEIARARRELGYPDERR